MSRKSQPVLSEQVKVSVIEGRSAGTSQFLDGDEIRTTTRKNELWPKDCSMHSPQPHKTRDRQLFCAGKLVDYFQWQPSKLIAVSIVTRPQLSVVVEWPSNAEPLHVGIDMQVLPAGKLFVRGSVSQCNSFSKGVI